MFFLNFICQLPETQRVKMYMHFQSIIFDGEEYWDCLELPCLLGSLVEDDISSVGSSGYASSDQDDSVDSQLQDLAFDALGETPAVGSGSLLSLPSVASF